LLDLSVLLGAPSIANELPLIGPDIVKKITTKVIQGQSLGLFQDVFARHLGA
jgi:hypothetical protein